MRTRNVHSYDDRKGKEGTQHHHCCIGNQSRFKFLFDPDSWSYGRSVCNGNKHNRLERFGRNSNKKGVRIYFDPSPVLIKDCRPLFPIEPLLLQMLSCSHLLQARKAETFLVCDPPGHRFSKT